MAAERAWLAGSSKLPYETQNYVEFITGRAAEEWKLDETQLPDALKTAGVEVDRKNLAGRFPPRVRAKELWRIPEPWLEEAQSDASWRTAPRRC